MRSVEEQQALVLAAVRRLPVYGAIPLVEALGMTLAEPVLAAVPMPVFDNSQMDGFAVRSADFAGTAGAVPGSAGAAEASGVVGGSGPVVLRVVAEVPAGSPDDPPIGPGEAVRIMTGAALPSDADAVVPVEDTVEGFAAALGGEVTVTVHPRPETNVRRAGYGARPGDLVVAAGVELGPLQLGAAAAAGVPTVSVTRRPRVAIVSTGSELVEPGIALGRGRIPESNSFFLAGLAARAGAEVVARESVHDDPEAVSHVLRRLLELEPDVVIFSGGVSAGAYEPVKQAFGSRADGAGAMEFASVSMQPAKPQGFGVTPAGALLFGLPGNPVSVAVSFEVFVRPALLAMQGRTELHRPRITLPAGEAWTPPPIRRQYLPARIDRTDPGRWTVVPAHHGGSQSHLAGGLALAEAYAVVPGEVEQVRAGDPVEVWLLD